MTRPETTALQREFNGSPRALPHAAWSKSAYHRGFPMAGRQGRHVSKGPMAIASALFRPGQCN